MARKKLLLFDIDGTLLLTGRAGEHALRVALQERFGVEDDLSGISFAGSTDGAIVRQMFEANAIPHTPENVADLLCTDARTAFSGCSREISRRVRS